MVSTRKDQKYKAAAGTPQPEPKKPKQKLPPEPKTGARYRVGMFASFQHKKNVPVRIHLNSGCDTPIIFKQWAESHGVPLVT
jgi:hypothetical protein